MNRIEERLTALKEEGKKAFITYTTAGLPDYDTTKKLMFAQEKAGIDIMEIGVPFSDPIADGPVIQMHLSKQYRMELHLKVHLQ